VGPRPDGTIEESHAARLLEMGDFLKKYGESIHATRGGPFIAPDEKMRPKNARGFALAEGRWWGGSTHQGNAIYLHILRWPSDTITLPAIAPTIVHHKVLTGGTAAIRQTASGIEVSIAAAQRHAVDTIVKLQLNGPAGGIASIHTE